MITCDNIPRQPDPPTFIIFVDIYKTFKKTKRKPFESVPKPFRYHSMLVDCNDGLAEVLTPVFEVWIYHSDKNILELKKNITSASPVMLIETRGKDGRILRSTDMYLD